MSMIFWPVTIFVFVDEFEDRFRNNDGASVIIMEQVIFLQEEVGQHFHRILQSKLQY